MLPKVLLSENIHPEGKKILQDRFQILIAPDTSEKTLLAMVPDVIGIVLRATSKVNRRVIESAPTLKVIARTGVGVDNVDVKAASERGIYVCYTPGMNDCTVAEHTIALLMALARQVLYMDKAVRCGQWQERFSEKQMEVADKTLGILGLGAIGQMVAKKSALGLGMKILAYDPYLKNKNNYDYITFTDSLEELFANSDFVSVHIPNVPENRRLVNRSLFSRMKKTAYFINTARGDLVDEEALFEALRENSIQGAALDVFATEPLPIDSPFTSLNNVILAPHVAGSTLESNIRIAVSAAKAVLDVFNGVEPEFVYNREFLNRN